MRDAGKPEPRSRGYGTAERPALEVGHVQYFEGDRHADGKLPRA